jgi:DNA repair protein RadC
MELQNYYNVAEVQLTYKPNYKPSERPQVTTSMEAYNIFMAHWSMERIEMIEEFKIILLNTKNRVLGIVDISKGGIGATYVDPRIVFVSALKARASAMVLCHNHPSGEFKPSEADKDLTRRLIQGGKVLDIQIFDHLVVGKHGYYSFGDDGILLPRDKHRDKTRDKCYKNRLNFIF